MCGMLNMQQTVINMHVLGVYSSNRYQPESNRTSDLILNHILDS